MVANKVYVPGGTPRMVYAPFEGRLVPCVPLRQLLVPVSPRKIRPVRVPE
jgi:hypothetical protein